MKCRDPIVEKWRLSRTIFKCSEWCFKNSIEVGTPKIYCQEFNDTKKRTERTTLLATR